MNFFTHNIDEFMSRPDELLDYENLELSVVPWIAVPELAMGFVQELDFLFSSWGQRQTLRALNAMGLQMGGNKWSAYLQFMFC